MYKLEETAKTFVMDEGGQTDGIDIGGLVTLMVSVMIGAIILGALLPTFVGSLGREAVVKDGVLISEAEGLIGSMPQLGGLVSLLPMLIVLIFVISIIFVLLERIKAGME